MMDLHQVARSPAVMRLGMLFSRYSPESLGHRLAWWAAGAICRLRPAVHGIVQANLSQVLGAGGDRQVLDQATRKVFSLAIRSYYDLFRGLQLAPEKMTAMVDIPEATRAVAHSLWNREGGTVVVLPHLSAFDLGGHAMVPYMPESQLLTLPDPPPGFQMLNESRSRSGVRITPLSSAALRDGLKLLRRGGVLTVGGDRPVSELDEPVPFFGRPARVPSGHVRLALQTGAVVALGYCILSPETQRYTMYLEQPIEMIRTGNRVEEIQINLRRILDALERIIGRWPEQWLMFVPVWPQLLPE
jgi:lauroyl/myristoyl acyltransferase